jgi:hypothetical protein
MSADPTAPRWSPGFLTDKRILHRSKRFMRGNRAQITYTLPPATVRRLDQLAREAGISRNALFNLAVHRLLDRGLS